MESFTIWLSTARAAGRQEATSVVCLSSWRMYTRSCHRPICWLFWCRTQVGYCWDLWGCRLCILFLFIAHHIWRNFSPSPIVSKLKLTTTPALTRNINTDIEMKCSVSSEPSASSRYAVTWLLHQQAENKTIVSSDQDALVTFGPQVQLSHRQRISMKRTKGPSFELNIRQARISDGGSYVCEVVEWLQDPHGDWYQLSPVSKTTKLTVIEPGKFVLKPEFSKNLTYIINMKCIQF